MKNSIIHRISVLFFCLCCNNFLFAQYQLHIHKTDGSRDTLYTANIQSLQCSKIALDGTTHPRFVTQEVITNEGEILRIPLEEIDSIGLEEVFMTINSPFEYNIDFNTDTITIEIDTNTPYEIIIPEEAQNWITIIENPKAIINLKIARNIGLTRNTKLFIKTHDNSHQIEFTIEQFGITSYKDIPNNEIWYTATEPVIPNQTAFDAKYNSNNSFFDAKTGKGVICFEEDIRTLGTYAFHGSRKLTGITVPNSVKSISSNAFAYCENLREIHFNDSLEFIGDSVFYNCSSITQLELPFTTREIGVRAFYGCTSIKTVSLGNSLENIGKYAFENCHLLYSITIPDSMKYIGESAFYGCGIAEIIIPNSIEKIGSSAFEGCGQLINIVIPNSVTEIGDFAFSRCSNLANLDIPSSVADIGKYAFSDCVNLKRLTLPMNLTHINVGTFYGCSTLTNILIPDSMTCIGSFAFDGCTSLTEIVIPLSVKEIEDGAFEGCVNLKKVTNNSLLDITIGSVTNGKVAYYADEVLGNSVGGYHFRVFNGIPYLTHYNGEETSLIFPSNYKGERYRIASSAFSKCSTIVAITIPASVTHIGNSAFSGCENLADINLSIGVEFIGELAFWGCKNLSSIEIPNSVTTIGRNAFWGCSNLESVTIGEGLKLVNKGAFGNCYNIKEFKGKYLDGYSLVIADTLIQFAGKSTITEYTIPQNIKYIEERAFNGCNLTHITLPEGLVSIGDYAFQSTYSLSTISFPTTLSHIGTLAFSYSGLQTIYCNPVIPPALLSDAFHLSSLLASIKFYVPNSAVSLYRTSDNWAQYADHIYSFNEIPSVYTSSDYSMDGTVDTLQSATSGEGIDIIIIGDGYSDRMISDSTYWDNANAAYNSLFTEEPYKSFKNLFNVYSVNAVSSSEGFENGIATVFGSNLMRSGTRVLPALNDNKIGLIKEYALKAIDSKRLENATIIILMNFTSTITGICHQIESSFSRDYGGLSISLVTVGPIHADFGPTIHHEALGHGFGKLADEYYYSGLKPTGEIIDKIKYQQSQFGRWRNIDFTNDSSSVKWNRFLSDKRYQYEGLGVYEGGMEYETGVWRPTENSIMRYNTGGFNAPSREAIYYRIHKLAYGEDWEYDYEKFVEWDTINRKTPYSIQTHTRSINQPIKSQLPPPVIMNKSWRNP